MDSLGEKVAAGVEAAKEKVAGAGGADVGAKLEALQEQAGGTGLETKISSVVDKAAEDGTGGVFGGKASELVGGEDKAAEKGKATFSHGFE